MKKLLFILFIFTSLSFAQKTFLIDTVSTNTYFTVTDTAKQIQFFPNVHYNIFQLDSVTFISNYSQATPYFISYYFTTSNSKDSASTSVLVYKNSSIIDENNCTYPNLTSSGSLFTNIALTDSLRFEIVHNNKVYADTLKAFKVKFLRMP